MDGCRRSDRLAIDRGQAGFDGRWLKAVPGRVTTIFRLLNDARTLLHEDQQAALTILAEIVLLLDDASGAATERRGGLAAWQVRRLTRHIEDGLEGALPQHGLAAEVRLSTSHFARAFKHSFGRTSHIYVTERRVVRAKQLMLGSDRSLCEIAVACGLSDQAHLSRVFRRVVGTTPLAWRRANQAIPDRRAPRPTPGSLQNDHGR